MFYKPAIVNGLPAYHKYIIYTDSNGNRFYARGGPGNFGPGSEDGSEASSSPFGPIQAEHGEYVPGTSDWDYEGDDPSEIITEGDDLSREWRGIQDEMDRQFEEYPYRPLDRNSN